MAPINTRIVCALLAGTLALNAAPAQLRADDKKQQSKPEMKHLHEKALANAVITLQDATTQLLAALRELAPVEAVHQYLTKVYFPRWEKAVTDAIPVGIDLTVETTQDVAGAYQRWATIVLGRSYNDDARDMLAGLMGFGTGIGSVGGGFYTFSPLHQVQVKSLGISTWASAQPLRPVQVAALAAEGTIYTSAVGLPRLSAGTANKLAPLFRPRVIVASLEGSAALANGSADLAAPMLERAMKETAQFEVRAYQLGAWAAPQIEQGALKLSTNAIAVERFLINQTLGSLLTPTGALRTARFSVYLASAAASFMASNQLSDSIHGRAEQKKRTRSLNEAQARALIDSSPELTVEINKIASDMAKYIGLTAEEQSRFADELRNAFYIQLVDQGANPEKFNIDAVGIVRASAGPEKSQKVLELIKYIDHNDGARTAANSKDTSESDKLLETVALHVAFKNLLKEINDAPAGILTAKQKQLAEETLRKTDNALPKTARSLRLANDLIDYNMEKRQ